MNPYMDNILENVGSYAVYGKALGDKMRKDVEYGTDPWPKAAGGIPGIVGKDGEFDKRISRIEQLQVEIASLEKQIKDYDEEEAMGRYKFQYDADPSTYTNTMQSRRNAEDTRRIREASDRATNQANILNSWKSAGANTEQNYWAMLKAKNDFEAAKGTKNHELVRSTKTAFKQAEAAYNRSLREQDELGAKVAELFGMSFESPKSVEEVGLDDPDVKYSRELADMDKKLGDLKQKLNPENTLGEYKTDIDETRRNAKRELAQYRRMVEESSLKPEEKKAILADISELDNMATKWTTQKGGTPPRKYNEKELEDIARREVFEENGKMKNEIKLRKLGSRKLQNYKKKYKWPISDELIQQLIREGK